MVFQEKPFHGPYWKTQAGKEKCPAYCSVRCKTATKKLSSHGTTDIVRSRDILVILRSQRVKRLHYSTDLLFPGDAPLFIS